MLVFALAGMALGTNCRATVPDARQGQYDVIPERNVFGLKPAQAEPAQINPPAQLPKITLTGITTILGNKRALMKVHPVGVKPGEAANELSLILTEGQREGEIEVLQINENLGSVRVNNSGTVMTLTFERDGAKLPATPAAPGVPGVPGPLPAAVVAPGNPYAPQARRELRVFPTRGSRLPGVAANAASGISGASTTLVPAPTGAASLPAQPTPAVGQDLTAEEQMIIEEIQRQVNYTNPIYSTLPPTASTPSAAETAGTRVPSPARLLVPQ